MHPPAFVQNTRQKMVERILQEVGGDVDQELFLKVYEFATQEDHSFLFTEFVPKAPPYQFRKRLDALIVPSELSYRATLPAGQHDQHNQQKSTLDRKQQETSG